MKKNNQTAEKPKVSKAQARVNELEAYACRLENMAIVYGHFYMKHGVWQETGSNEDYLNNIATDIIDLVTIFELPTDYIYTFLSMRYPTSCAGDIIDGYERAKKFCKDNNIAINPISRKDGIRLFISKNVPHIAACIEDGCFDEFEELLEDDLY